ncbi:MAG: hypothetical protein ACI8YQ_005268 [Polaribacter sp.]
MSNTGTLSISGGQFDNHSILNNNSLNLLRLPFPLFPEGLLRQGTPALHLPLLSAVHYQ